MAKLGAQDVPLTGLPPRENAYVLTELPRSYWDYYNHRIQVCVCVCVCAGCWLRGPCGSCVRVCCAHASCVPVHPCVCVRMWLAWLFEHVA